MKTLARLARSGHLSNFDYGSYSHLNEGEMEQRLYNRTPQWLEEWKHRCESMLGDLEAGRDAEAVAKASAALEEFYEDVPHLKPSCPKHPNGCPMVINHPSLVVYVVETIGYGCVYELNRAIQLN